MIRLLFLLQTAVSLAVGSVAIAQEGAWKEKSPRAEIAPKFTQPENGDLILESEKPGTNGHFLGVFPIKGGNTYEFSAVRIAENIEHERRSCVVRIEWYGENGKPVLSPYKVNPAYFGKDTDSARPDFPRDFETRKDGSVLVKETYLAPEDATEAHIQLHLRWTDSGKVTWRDVNLVETKPLPPRLVKLAAVHHNLSGITGENGKKSVTANREALVPLIEKAARQGADLIVLGEFSTCKGVTSVYAEAAEPVPGPSTKFFGALAKKHDTHIVASLPERDGHEVFNTAVLLGPDGEIIGKYRKVTLPREEIQQGISPGTEYPVFETRFGKVGMMVCYDVFFPEVARELSFQGAEVIALPIWGGNPRLAAARCAENGVYLVTSTYTNHESNWMKTAVWDREGNRIAEADEWGTVIMAEVDLNQPTHWQFLGDFKSRISREAPVRLAE
ncbi:MAG: carbon-nitrogen hydrolase family protein [Verrucomicrobiales bacterium]|nr:carbon-nitrogen hydrolase family protein [Verrucomicrobiales bacterium]